MSEKIFKVKAVAIDDNGKGIVRVNNETIFVDNLLEGEEGDIKTIYQFGKLKETKLLRRLTSSKFRVNPPCRYYSSCGGCSLMHLDYHAQLEYKRKKVQNLLHKFAHLDFEVSDTLGMEDPYHFRNKIQVPLGLDKKGKIISGFYKEGTHQIVAQEECLIESEIAKVTREIETPAVEWSYAREGDKLLVKNGVTGIIADKEAARLEIISKLDKMVNMLDNPVNIKTEEVHPEKVDIDKIQKQITKKVQNAEYISDTGDLIEQIIGIEIEDVDQAKKLANSITEEGMQFSIPLLITMPEITTENVLGELFRDKLSTYTTYFNVNEVERTENVRLAAEFIDDVILMPGQEFSYNNIVGERSTERGFKTAKVYQQGQVVDGLGGGICQVSSTLYNAVVMADLEVLERKNHSLSVSYVKLGRDATVVYGSIDFRFKNSRQYPIKISSKISGGTLTIEIYGYNTNKTRLVDIETEVIEVLPFKEQEIQDATMPVGTSKITTTGHKGYKVKSYRVTTENGEVVERKFIATDIYSPVAQVKRVGIAAN